MFSLMYGFWKLLFSKTEFHVLIVGLDHAGKTVRSGARTSVVALRDVRLFAAFSCRACLNG